MINERLTKENLDIIKEHVRSRIKYGYDDGRVKDVDELSRHVEKYIKLLHPSDYPILSFAAEYVAIFLEHQYLLCKFHEQIDKQLRYDRLETVRELRDFLNDLDRGTVIIDTNGHEFHMDYDGYYRVNGQILKIRNSEKLNEVK